MGRLIKTAFTITATVLIQRAVGRYFDRRDAQRSVSRASSTGLGV